MQFDDAAAQRANPVLRISVQRYVPDIEVSSNMRALEVVYVSGEFEWAEQELVPNFFYRDDYVEFLRQGQQLPNASLRTRVSVRVRCAGIHNGRNDQHRVRTPEMCIAK